MQTALLLLFLLAGSLTAQQHEDPAAVAGRAGAAYEAGRWADAAELHGRVVQMASGSISAKVNHARALARAGKPDEALARLRTVTCFGVRFDPADEAWGGLRGDGRFRALVSTMEARTAPLIRSETAFLLEKHLVPENIAHDPETGDFYAGSMYRAKIVRIAPDGKVTDFVPSRRDGLMSVLGMKVDAARRELWAVTGNFVDRPPMEAGDPATRGQGAIFRYDLRTGRLIRRYARPGGTPEAPTWLNDLVLAPNGDVYATAGADGIFVVRDGSDAVEPFFSMPGGWFNGIALTPDGGTLFAASHLDGVVKIDVATKKHAMLVLPENVTLGGIDGLYVHGDSLVGVQNGTEPSRVVRAWLDPERTRVTRFAVLEQAHPLSDIPLTGAIVGDDLYYVARSQLRAFDGMKIWPDDRLKETVILRLPLEPPGPPPPDLAREREALLALHREGIRAHVERDAASLCKGLAEQFVSAAAGKIEWAEHDEVCRHFEGYLAGAEYSVYEDLEPPVLRISDDASMAWMITRLRVKRTQNGKERSFVYAGILTYENRGGTWVTVGNVSTFE